MMTGTWPWTNVGNQSEQSCAFTQKDAALTGTCRGERGEVQITGKVDGKSVTWQFEIDYEGTKLTPLYTGTLEAADKIAGSVDIQGMGIGGDFVATRAK